LDEKTGKSYLFFLIEDGKRIGVERVFFSLSGGENVLLASESGMTGVLCLFKKRHEIPY